MNKFDTTTNFITAHVNAGTYPAGVVIETLGYSAIGGVGGSKWMSTGNTITASQDPLALNDTKLSDASGNEFSLVLEESGIIDLNVLGGTSASYVNIANAAGLTYSQGLTSDVSVDVKAQDTVDTMINTAGVAVGEAFNVKVRSTGNGGGGLWDAVLTSSVTPNTFNIIIGVSDPLISFVLRESDIIDASQYGVATGATDAVNFAAGQAAIDRGRSVKFPSTFNIDDEFIPANSNTVLYFNGGIIRQNTIDKAVIKATGLDNFFIVANKQVFFGEGTWSTGWTGNDGHDDRVIQFITCTNSGISDPVIKNGANAGLSIEGCSNFFGDNIVVEGTTNNGGVPLSGVDPNFQNGIYIKHSPTNGDCKDIYCTFDVSDLAQGILVEGYAAFTGQGNNIVLEGIAHDIIGQHGVYCQTGDAIIDVTVRNTNLSGVKLQANNAGHDLKNFNVKLLAEDIGSHALEIQDANGSASLENIIFDVVCNNVMRGLGINVNGHNIKGRLICKNSSQYGAIIQGAGLSEIDLDMYSEDSGRHGLYITATGCTGVRIKPVIRQANTSVGPYDGIQIEQTGDITLYDPEATDTGGNQRYGLFNTAGDDVKIRGSAKFTGAATNSARSNVALIEWPEKYTLDGTSSAQLINFENFSTIGDVNRRTAQTVSTSQVTLWQMLLDDESAYEITATILGKLADSSERGTQTTSVLFYRDAGGSATKEGADTDIVDRTSAGFTGTIIWEGSGNNARIRIHSGAATTYDWEARVSISKVS